VDECRADAVFQRLLELKLYAPALTADLIADVTTTERSRTAMAKPSEGINFPSMNNIDSELPGVKVPKSTWRPFDDLLDHLKGGLLFRV